MRRLQRQRVSDIRQCLRDSLVRQAVHQIEIEIRQARDLQLLDCALRIGSAVDATQALELSGVEALRTERYAGNSGGAIIGKAAALDRTRVGLQRDFQVSGELEPLLHAAQKPRQRGGREQTGRAAAKE